MTLLYLPVGFVFSVVLSYPVKTQNCATPACCACSSFFLPQ